MLVAPFSSTFSLPTFTRPAYASAIASTVGVIMRQGPHHSAQKSTRTGASEFRTSLSQVASVNVKVFAPAIIFLSPPKSNRCRNRPKDSACQKPPIQLDVLASGGVPREVLLHATPHPARPIVLILE